MSEKSKSKKAKKIKLKTDKVIVVCSDFHCGHRAGLTHPDYIVSYNKEIKKSPVGHIRKKFSDLQKKAWDWFSKSISDVKKQYGRIDIVFAVGDLIDGRGERSGGTELIVTDRLDQCNLATLALEEIGASQYFLLYGTPYHTGAYEDYENIIAENVNAVKIGSHEWVDVNGVVFDLKHHIGSSSIPHTKGTPIGREKLQNYMWAVRKEQPNSDVIIRAHVHNYYYCGDANWLGMTLPALQWYGSKYGARRCSGTVDFGFVVFHVTKEGEVKWEPKLAKFEVEKQSVLKA